jgi:uncharacterized protein YukE
MAAKNGSASKAAEVQAFVKEQIEEAQKRIQAIEGEAQKALKGLVARGKESRQELQQLLRRFNAKELKFLDNPTVKKLGKRAGAAGMEMKKRLDALQERMIEASGMATQSQIRDLNRELNKLSRKVDTLVKGKPEARA